MRTAGIALVFVARPPDRGRRPRAGYPVKPVRVVVPFPPGGGTDVQARVLFKELNEQLRQVFIVDNRPGAGGLIGADAVVNSPADGYTLLFTTATLAINATLYRSTLKSDPTKELAPVIWVSTTPLVLIVHPGVAAKSAEEPIALARTKHGALNAAINVPAAPVTWRPRCSSSSPGELHDRARQGRRAVDDGGDQR